MNSFATRFPLLVAISLGIAQWSFAAEWPQFRGPNGQGHASATNLPLKWSETKNIKWKTEIPGRGWSSPVIEGNQIWITTASDTPAGAADREQRLKTNTGGQPLIVSSKVTFRAICVDRDSGKVLHNVELKSERSPQWVHKLNSYASPTPIIENGRLYCHFGTFGTVCLDTKSGKVLWINNELHVMHENGPGGSPALWNDLIIFHLDGSDKQYIAALNKNTGEVAWTTPRSGVMNSNPQLKKSYGTPLVLKVNGKDQIISPASDWVYGYDPASGAELWRVKYGTLGFSLVPRPVAGHGMFFLCTSFMRSRLLAIQYEGVKQPHIAWSYARSVPTMSSPLLIGDDVFIVNDKGIVTCLDAKTGIAHYQEKLGGVYSASPLFADGKILICERKGETTILAPGKTMKILGKNKLDGQLFASPVAVDESLYIRTDKALYRIQKLAGE